MFVSLCVCGLVAIYLHHAGLRVRVYRVVFCHPFLLGERAGGRLPEHGWWPRVFVLVVHSDVAALHPRQGPVHCVRIAYLHKAPPVGTDLTHLCITG